ncbi:MAG: thioredoxin domain-containing protein [Planctomycetota bacterium]
MAILNGKPIYRADVEQHAAFQFYRLRANIYRLRKREIDKIVNERLLAEEAAGRGLNVQQLLRKEVQEKVETPGDAEIEAYLAEHLKKGEEPARKRNRIRIYLHQHALIQRKLDFMASLRVKAEYKLLIEPPRQPRTRLNIEGEPWSGNPEALVTLVHFSDLTSKLCAHSAQKITRIMADYPGQIKWIHRNYLRKFDELALYAAKMGEWALEQGLFWKFHDRLITFEDELTPNDIKKIGTELGLYNEGYLAGEKEGRFLLRVKADIEVAKSVGVTSVSAIFVNGIYFSSTFPYEQLKQLVKDELNRVASR